jgi:hypothetical protein
MAAGWIPRRSDQTQKRLRNNAQTVLLRLAIAMVTVHVIDPMYCFITGHFSCETRIFTHDNT